MPNLEAAQAEARLADVRGALQPRRTHPRRALARATAPVRTRQDEGKEALSEVLPLVVHLSSGAEVPAELEVAADQDADEALDDLRERLAGRSQWLLIGDVLLFSGAVSAIHPK
jgi:hypothetical protein